MPDYTLRATDLVAAYQTLKGDVKAVDSVSFSLPTTGVVGIAGESGCGKTTLIKTLYGMVEPPLKIISGEVNVKTDE
ncbi:MAG: ATP-binding cassette domain-containing protein, partial [Methanobacteriota archaeon]